MRTALSDDMEWTNSKQKAKKESKNDRLFGCEADAAPYGGMLQ
jgi:hypothetical protein